MATTEAQRQYAADLHSMFTALVDEGFAGDQAVALLCCLIEPRPARSGSAERSEQVSALLAAAGKRPPPSRSPADDRAADLWNPPAPEPGAPAHE
ncbi:hypothetical protein JNW90_09185 [Micromonospora sp. STR1s_5]|nr:hypothetical protein [Micromonospora sp. STR1s_5]MBM0203267.1 hypothetical protein [Micromonospora sp. STR1s_5]